MQRAAGLAACVALLIAAAPSFAQTQSSGQPAPPPKEKDPNCIICEKVEEIGSRLASARVCLTAQQWEEKRIQDRRDVEDAQRRQRH